MAAPCTWILPPSSMTRNTHQVISRRIGPGRPLTSITVPGGFPSANPPR